MIYCDATGDVLELVFAQFNITIEYQYLPMVSYILIYVR